MKIYILMYIYLICTYILFYKKNKKMFCISAGIVSFLLLALRKPEFCKRDIVNLYLPAFELVQKISFPEITTYFANTEWMFYFFMKCLTYISSNFNVFLTIIAIPFVYIFSKFIYKYSKQPLISYFIFFGFSYYYLSFIVLRHCLALAFLVLALMYLLENKDKKFFIIVFFTAFCIHRTAILFLIAYFVKKVKFNKILSNIFILVSLGIAIIGQEILTLLIFSVFDTGHFSLYMSEYVETMNLNFFAVNFVFFIFCEIYITKKNIEDRNIKFMFNLFTIGVACSSFTIYRDVAYRIALFFLVPEIILIPNALENIKNENNKILITLVILVFFVIYSLFSTIDNLELVNYLFLWE